MGEVTGRPGSEQEEFVAGSLADWELEAESVMMLRLIWGWIDRELARANLTGSCQLQFVPMRRSSASQVQWH